MTTGLAFERLITYNTPNLYQSQTGVKLISLKQKPNHCLNKKKHLQTWSG